MAGKGETLLGKDEEEVDIPSENDDRHKCLRPDLVAMVAAPLLVVVGIIIAVAITAGRRDGTEPKENSVRPASIGAPRFQHAAVPACNSTVAYLFLTEGELPLASAWRTYLDGCPAGSYSVRVLSTSGAPASLGALADEAVAVPSPAAYAGKNLRFSYDMVDAMHRLWEAGAGAKTSNGCGAPRWAQLVSSSCAPVASCASFHRHLGRTAGTSHFRGGRDARLEPTAVNQLAKAQYAATGISSQCVLKASQWSTLWMPHALKLLAHEAENAAAWRGALAAGMLQGASNTGAPDELYPIAMHQRYGLRFSHGAGSTYTSWADMDAHQDGKPSRGHPDTYACGAGAGSRSEVAAISAARQEGTAFVRKWDVTGACSARLEQVARDASRDASELQQPPQVVAAMCHVAEQK